MPKYRNNTNAVVNVDGKRIEPLEVIETLKWLRDLPAGVEKISDSPSYNPILMSQSYTTSGAIILPDTGGNPYKVRIWVEAGMFNLAFNEASALPVLVMAEGVEWVGSFHERLLDHIYLSQVVSGKVWVQVEKY